MKPLGYYLNHCSMDHASQVEELINALHQLDKLGLIEWLTHDLAQDFQNLEGEWERAGAELEEARRDAK